MSRKRVRAISATSEGLERSCKIVWLARIVVLFVTKMKRSKISTDLLLLSAAATLALLVQITAADEAPLERINSGLDESSCICGLNKAILDKLESILVKSQNENSQCTDQRTDPIGRPEQPDGVSISGHAEANGNLPGELRPIEELRPPTVGPTGGDNDKQDSKGQTDDKPTDSSSNTLGHQITSIWSEIGRAHV